MKESTKFCGFTHNGYLKYPKLQELYFCLFHTYFSNEHNALADIRATAECFWKLIDLGVIKSTEYPSSLMNDEQIIQYRIQMREQADVLHNEGKIENAIDKYKVSSALGDIDAKYQLGKILYRTKNRKNEGIALIREASKTKDDALLWLINDSLEHHKKVLENKLYSLHFYDVHDFNQKYNGEIKHYLHYFSETNYEYLKYRINKRIENKETFYIQEMLKIIFELFNKWFSHKKCVGLLESTEEQKWIKDYYELLDYVEEQKKYAEHLCKLLGSDLNLELIRWKRRNRETEVKTPKQSSILQISKRLGVIMLFITLPIVIILCYDLFLYNDCLVSKTRHEIALSDSEYKDRVISENYKKGVFSNNIDSIHYGFGDKRALRWEEEDSFDLVAVDRYFSKNITGIFDKELENSLWKHFYNYPMVYGRYDLRDYTNMNEGENNGYVEKEIADLSNSLYESANTIGDWKLIIDKLPTKYIRDANARFRVAENNMWCNDSIAYKNICSLEYVDSVCCKEKAQLFLKKFPNSQYCENIRSYIDLISNNNWSFHFTHTIWVQHRYKFPNGVTHVSEGHSETVEE